ncbi:MAG TPA: hypothetical protein PLD02_06350 [Saprospiraceae bacterium]|nr:hypothetical protein [Saprospiraceae bacterium]
MKNLFYLLSLISIMFVNCKTEDKQLSKNEIMKIAADSLNFDEIKELLLEKSIANNSNLNKESREYSNSLKFENIDISIAKKMVNEWVKYRDNIFSNKDDIERSVTFNATMFTAFPKSTQYVRFYFGQYETSDDYIKEYLVQFDTPGFKYSEKYAKRFSVIVAFLDSNYEILGNTLVNFGGLCPPKCPQGIAGDLPDPLWP